jgi:hypothetical protein
MLIQLPKCGNGSFVTEDKYIKPPLMLKKSKMINAGGSGLFQSSSFPPKKSKDKS